MADKQTFYMTFGYGQNPGIGYYCTIDAENESTARAMMAKEYKNRWCGTYLTAEAAGVDRFNLQKVDFGFRFYS